MAFERQAFAFNGTGEPDDDEFLCSLRRETAEMRKNLAGNNSSTGLMGMGSRGGASASGALASSERAEYNSTVRVLLRDCLVSGYDDALLGKPAAVPSDPVLGFAHRALLEMSLVLSAERVS